MADYETIDLEGLKTHLDKGHLVLNVLDEEEFEKMHIPGTKNVPVDAAEFGEKVRSMTEATTEPVVVYCASEECQASPRAARKLTEIGLENVYDFEGGIKAWKDAGLDLEGETQTMSAAN